MSSSLVAANPRSAKTSSAALTISSGRASLRRRQRGFAGFGRFVAVRMRGRNLVTKRSVSKVVPSLVQPGVLLPSGFLAVVQDEVRTWRRRSKLAQERHDLAMIV